MTTFTAALSTDAWNRPAIGIDTEIGQLGVLTEDTVHRPASRPPAAPADVAEARTLLAMLGLGAVEEPRGEPVDTVRTEANRRRREARASRRSAC